MLKTFRGPSPGEPHAPVEYESVREATPLCKRLSLMGVSGPWQNILPNCRSIPDENVGEFHSDGYPSHY
jgi:hypothetical protein